MMSHQFVNLFPQGGVDAHDVGRGKLNVVQQHLWDYRHQGVTCEREKKDGKKSRVIISVVKLQSCHPNFCNIHDGGISIQSHHNTRCHRKDDGALQTGVWS